MSSKVRVTQPYLPTLDGWRAIAVFLVMLAHTTKADESGAWYQHFGGLGVSIFFGISGFLICSRLLSEFDQSSTISLKSFYIRRAFRILPASWCYLSVISLLSLLQIVRVSIVELLACVFVFRNYVPWDSPFDGYYTGHFWSLSVEEHFYFILPALFLFLRPSRSFWVFPIVALGVTVWRVIDSRHHFGERIIGNVLSYARTDHRMDCLLWGCWVAIFLWKFPNLRNGWFLRISGVASLLILVQGIIWETFLHSYIVAVVFPGFLIPVVLAMSVYDTSGLWSALLENRPIRWVGRLSYSLYLWQQLFFVIWDNRRIDALGPLQEWPLQWLAVFACASFSYYFIERPLIRIGHRLAGRGDAIKQESGTSS